MSCPFYTFRYNEYYCIKACKDVKESAYRKYCRNYDYDDCPAYKMTSEYKSDYQYLSMYRGNSDDSDSSDSNDSSSSDTGCFLTSACTAARGLPDDCHELQTLRAYRDIWLKHQPDGILLIAQYYEVAPKIVAAIDQLDNRLEIYDSIYLELVLPCVALIEANKQKEALDLYSDTVLRMEKEYRA